MPNSFAGRMTVHYLDHSSPEGIGEVVYDTKDGQELWQMKKDHAKGVWVKDKLLRRRSDCAFTACLHNRTPFPKGIDKDEVAL